MRSLTHWLKDLVFRCRCQSQQNPPARIPTVVPFALAGSDQGVAVGPS